MTSASPARGPAAPAGLASRLFAAGSLAFFLLGMLPALFGVALPHWTAAFGLAVGEGGTILSVYNAGAVVAVLAGVSGMPGLATRPALVLVAAGGAALALGAGWAALLIGAFVAGLGYGILAASVNRRFLQEFGTRGPGMVSFVNGIYGLGSILSPLLFLAAGSSPAVVFWAVAALALLAMALARPEPFRQAAPGLPPLSPRLLILLLNLGGVTMELLLIGFGASALIAQGVPEAGAAQLLSAFFLAFVAARLGLALVVHRIAPDLAFLGSCLGLAATAALAALVSPGLGFVLAGVFAGTAFPCFYVWASRLLGPDPRMGAAILASGLTAGTLGPLALRPILAAFGEGGLFWILACFGTILSAVVALLLPRLRRLPPP